MPQEIIIKPGHGGVLLKLKEIWNYRDFLYFLVRQQVLVKYKQTILGPAYTVINPVISMVVFTIFFGKVAKLPNDDIPYPLFYYSALVPWGYFSGVLVEAGQSLNSNRHILTKVYIPRLIFPLVPALAKLVNFFIAFSIIFLMMAYYRVAPSPSIVYIPILVLIMMIASTGVGLCLTALNVKFRDVGFAIGIIVQMWMFASPIVYPYSMIPEDYRMYYALNPMTGVIEGFRSVLVGSGTLDWTLIGVSLAVSLAIFLPGLLYFNRVEKTFVDVA